MLSGCGHAGIVNTVRYARRLTGEDAIAAVIGGFHLSGPMFEPVIEPTVEAFADLAPGLLSPRMAPAGARSTGSRSASPTRS